jgi:hypothetical protein
MHCIEGQEACDTDKCTKVNNALEEFSLTGTGDYGNAVTALVGTSLFGASVPIALAPVLIDGQLSEFPFELLVLSSSCTFGAWAAGSLVLGALGDRLGRKPVLVGSGILATVSLLSMAASTNVWSLVVARTLGGVSLGGLVGQGFSFAVESVPTAKSDTVSSMVNAYWTAACCLVALVHLGCGAVGVGWQVEYLLLASWIGVATVATQQWTVESPVFLAANGREAQAAASLRRIAHIDAVPASSVDGVQIDAWIDPEDADELTVAAGGVGEFFEQAATELFSESLRQQSVTLGLTFAFVNVGYYGITFAAGSLSDALVLNFVLLAACDLPGFALSASLSSAIGRQRLTPIALAAYGALLCALALASETGLDEQSTTGLALVAKCSGALVYPLLYLLPVDCGFPARIRGTALGVGLICARLGGAHWVCHPKGIFLCSLYTQPPHCPVSDQFAHLRISRD